MWIGLGEEHEVYFISEVLVSRVSFLEKTLGGELRAFKNLNDF